ncbi:MAG: hypothetical protein QOH85_1096 [Acidobacteriaceae bacterium]|jgi:hypothetical protein|nr:hypothetical protein [Acidobacteriaceae bacterium]
MGDQKINVNSGGTVSVGETFKWQNTGPGKVKIINCSAFLTDAEYKVDPPGNGKSGEKDATVLSNATPGNYQYQVDPDTTGTNPTMTVKA